MAAACHLLYLFGTSVHSVVACSRAGGGAVARSGGRGGAPSFLLSSPLLPPASHSSFSSSLSRLLCLAAAGSEGRGYNPQLDKHDGFRLITCALLPLRNSSLMQTPLGEGSFRLATGVLVQTSAVVSRRCVPRCGSYLDAERLLG